MKRVSKEKGKVKDTKR